MELKQISGHELAEVANNQITDDDLTMAMAEPYVRDFIKICLLLNNASPFVHEPQRFGYWFFVKHTPENEIYEVEFDVKVKATKLGGSKEGAN